MNINLKSMPWSSLYRWLVNVVLTISRYLFNWAFQPLSIFEERTNPLLSGKNTIYNIIYNI